MRVSWVTGNASLSPAVRFRELAVPVPVPGGAEENIQLAETPAQVASWHVRSVLSALLIFRGASRKGKCCVNTFMMTVCLRSMAFARVWTLFCR